jgi:hypothetical protein
MQGRDPHTALKSEMIGNVNAGRMQAAIARLQWGKTDVGYSLHVNPSEFSSAGLQTKDFLAYLGFQRSDRCTFSGFGRCYVRWVGENFDLQTFATAFNKGFGHLEQAQRALEACGFALPQPEGWGFFYGRDNSRRPHRGPTGLSGDGYTANLVRSMKSTEDESFAFKFSFIEAGREKGFVTHYRPKHPPLSSELASVFKYLGIYEFAECPEFDFESCYFRTLLYEPRGGGMFDNNTEYAHRNFDAHAAQFSPGIRNLLEANAAVEAVGMPFLPLALPAERNRADIDRRIVVPSKADVNAVAKPTASGNTRAMPEKFDVAISFAGTERTLAQELAESVRSAGFAVFYDDFYPEELWGKNLATFFDEIFRKRSRFCVMFISREYQQRKWTIHEARSAQARALEERGSDYILPIKIDEIELDGLLPTLGYVSINAGIDKIGQLLLKKLKT